VVVSIFAAAATLSTLVEKSARHELLRELATLGVVASRGQTELSWITVAAINVWFWAPWAVLTPFIVGVARRLEHRSRLHQAGGWLLIGTAACAIQFVIAGALRVMPNGTLALQVPAELFLGFRSPAGSKLTVVTFALIAAGTQALMYFEDAQRRRRREAALETRLARAELQMLRMQLHPHFFFNTLHTVSALMVDDVPAARRVLAALGDLLRHSIAETGRQEVTLREEIEFASRYVDIQQARFGEALVVRFDAPDTLGDALLPSFVLQPLLENAIRHGVEPYVGSGTVTVAARVEHGRLTVSVVNAIADAAQTREAGQGRSSGVGLANIRARLEQLYPNRYTFVHVPTTLGYLASFTIPLRRSTTPSARSA
jgi:two-component system, LytTR family, sensor kinase